MTRGELSEADLAEFTAQFRAMAERLAETAEVLGRVRDAAEFPAELAPALDGLLAQITYLRRLSEAMVDGDAADWERRQRVFLEGLALLNATPIGTMH